MKVFAAQIVDEPENAPTLILATSEEELLQKLKADASGLQHLNGLQEATTCEEVAELWEDAKEEGMLYEYSGVFLSEQEL
jgi:hypothetical protein